MLKTICILINFKYKIVIGCKNIQTLLTNCSCFKLTSACSLLIVLEIKDFYDFFMFKLLLKSKAGQPAERF